MSQSRSFYFHGTVPETAEIIRNTGFKHGRVPVPWDDEPDYLGYGNIGLGTYITVDWRVAILYGYTLLRLTTAPGTRFLTVPSEPDRSLLRSIKRRYGQEMLWEMRPTRLLPPGKNLSLTEHVTLLTHHYRKVEKYFWSEDSGCGEKKDRQRRRHVLAMHALGSQLRRFGIHGYGEPDNHAGIVVFEPDRLVVEAEITADMARWMAVTGVFPTPSFEPEDLGLSRKDLE